MPRAFDTAPLSFLLAELAGIPADVRRVLRPAARAAALPVLKDMRARASWSSRIPGAIAIRSSFGSGSRVGVRLSVDALKAPHARPYEMGSRKNRNLRHPVYADPQENREDWTWVEENRRPFFFPAITEGGQQAADKLRLAVLAAARDSGVFR